MVDLKGRIVEEFSRLKHDVDHIAKEPWVSFQEGVPAREEGYKTHLRAYALTRLRSSSWTREQIGTGTILDAVIHAIEIDGKKGTPGGSNNLVQWTNRRGPKAREHVQIVESKNDGVRCKHLETLFFDMFCGGVEDGGSFEALCNSIGRSLQRARLLVLPKEW